MHLCEETFQLTCNGVIVLLLLLDGSKGVVLILALLVLVDRLGDLVLVPQLLPLEVPLIVLLLVLVSSLTLCLSNCFQPKKKIFFLSPIPDSHIDH